MKIRLVLRGGVALRPVDSMKRTALHPEVLVTVGIPAVKPPTAIPGLVVWLFILVDKSLHQGLHDKMAGSPALETPR